MRTPSCLLLHGWRGSGPGHWQAWLDDRVDGACLPALPDADHPRLDAWLDALRATLAACDDPPVVLCHSLGCVLWLHHAATRPPDSPRAARVALVAPPCACAEVPEIADFFPVPRDPLAVAAAAIETTRLVCSDADHYCPEGAQVAYGERLGCPVDFLPGAGHLNAEAGYGAWPAMEAWARGTRTSVGDRSSPPPT